MRETKHDLRTHVTATLRELSADAIAGKSALRANRLFITRWRNDAGTVPAFCSMPREVDTRDILAREFEHMKTAGFPRVCGDDLVFHRLKHLNAAFSIGAVGIREPSPAWPIIDLDAMRVGTLPIITPAPAFDRRLNRLGRGKGFYNRFLRMARAQYDGTILAVGICLPEQLIDTVPITADDEPVDAVITECETLYEPWKEENQSYDHCTQT